MGEKIPPNSNLIFDVELLDFKEKEKEKWEYSPQERMEKALQLKDEGTKEFTAGRYDTAATLYKDAAEYVNEGNDDDDDITETLPDDEKDVYIKCMANAAMCYVKFKQWSDVIDCCNQVFTKAPEEKVTNVKVLYRRGLAKMYIGDKHTAKIDLTTNSKSIVFFSALKTRFSASEIYVGIIHAENLFDI